MAECLRLMDESYLLMGTMGYWLNNEFTESTHTTPDPDVLFDLLAKAVRQGVNYCLMEVSSHAISQKKVSPIIYEAVAFTSFSRDHLDFHSSMKEYFDVKWGFVSQQINHGARAFVSEGVCKYIDEYVESKEDFKFESYSDAKQGFAGFKICDMSIEGTSLTIMGQHSAYAFDTKLMGHYAIENLVAAVLCIEAVTGRVMSLKRTLEIRSVPGRLDVVKNSKKRFVFVDYAHTPDALYKTCELLKPLCQGSFKVLFGAGEIVTKVSVH